VTPPVTPPVTTLTIRLLPDPVLRARAAPVAEFGPDLAALARAMLGAMYAAPGRGLAAPQVGLPLRLFVMDAGWKEGAPDPRVFVNPAVLWSSPETATRGEGCLSIPGRTFRVTRPARVRLAWQTLDGAAREEEFAGFAAACVQHETDHLDGVLICDIGEAGEAA
jgi:peptide deformylase